MSTFRFNRRFYPFNAFRSLLGIGGETAMSQDIAETYARDPYFYSGTFCVGCGGHFPVGEDGEFAWDDESKVGT